MKLAAEQGLPLQVQLFNISDKSWLLFFTLSSMLKAGSLNLTGRKSYHKGEHWSEIGCRTRSITPSADL